MEPEFTQEYATAERDHWWFVARRQILAKALNSLHLDPECEILEVGCGSGGNLELLSRYGNVYAHDCDAVARELANSRKIVQVEYGMLPDNIPFKEQRFDLIALLDVLEHIDDDVAALGALYGRLKPNGVLLVTVPAYNFLWSHHDVVNEHKRRYHRVQLERLMHKVGYHVKYMTYFNTLLFPAILAIRFLENVLRMEDANDISMPSKYVNAILRTILASERVLIPHMRLPFGLSILAIARK